MAKKVAEQLVDTLIEAGVRANLCSDRRQPERSKRGREAK